MNDAIDASVSVRRNSVPGKTGAGDHGITADNIRKSESQPISTKIRLMKALVWPAATYSCESWTLRKNDETRFNASEMKGLRKILWVSGQQRKQMIFEWVLNKPGVKRELLDIVKARNLAYYSHTMRKQGSCSHLPTKF